MKTKDAATVGANASWTQLSNWPSEALFRGTVLRCLKAEWPYEDVVDFMIVAEPDSPCGFSIIVATGYKAGLALVLLPAEAKAPNAQALSTEWVIANWNKWVYPECPLELVQVVENYPTQINIESAAPSASRDLKLP